MIFCKLTKKAIEVVNVNFNGKIEYDVYSSKENYLASKENPSEETNPQRLEYQVEAYKIEEAIKNTSTGELLVKDILCSKAEDIMLAEWEEDYSKYPLSKFDLSQWEKEQL